MFGSGYAFPGGSRNESTYISPEQRHQRFVAQLVALNVPAPDFNEAVFQHFNASRDGDEEQLERLEALVNASD